MNKKLRVLILLITVSFLIGALPSTSAMAGSNQGPIAPGGPAKISQILTDPCNVGIFHENLSIPLYTCSGYSGVGSYIAFPLRTWATDPAYPLANFPFYISLGTELPNNPYLFPTRDKTYPGAVQLRGVTTEIRLVTINQKLNLVVDTNFNGMIDYDPWENKYWAGEGQVVNRWHKDVLKLLEDNFNPPDVNSVAASGNKYYDAGSAVDTIDLHAFSLNSSYFANNPTTYRGEPAYRIHILSYYQIQAKTSLQNYRYWEYLPDGTKTVCKPGPSGSGVFNCVTSSGVAGHKVTETVYAWKWGAWQVKSGESFSTGWHNVENKAFVVKHVRWPDGSVHDHMPLLIYQSQPLLTQP